MCLQETLLSGAPLPGLLSMPTEAARGLTEVAENNCESYQPSDQPSLGSQRKRCSSVARCVSLRMSVCVMNTDTCMYACVYVCMGVYLYL